MFYGFQFTRDRVKHWNAWRETLLKDSWYFRLVNDAAGNRSGKQPLHVAREEKERDENTRNTILARK
jgi:hypothetical protein